MPEVLSSTVEYLKQCSSAEVDDAIDLEPEILATLEKASADATSELSGKRLDTFIGDYAD